MQRVHDLCISASAPRVCAKFEPTLMTLSMCSISALLIGYLLKSIALLAI
jgi:hypothetical protein